MKRILKVLAVLLGACGVARAQVQPAATGPHKIAIGGTLQYSLRYAQTADIYSNGVQNEQVSVASGNVRYGNDSERLPFSAMFGAGYGWVDSGPSYGGGFFENLLLSQGLVGTSWNMTVSDELGYRKESPSTGFTGVPGTGEPIGQQNPSTSDQGIVGINTIILNNNLDGEFRDRITNAFTLNTGAASTRLIFPDGGGIDTDTFTAHGGLTDRLNARNTVFGDFQYADYSYSSNGVKFQSDAMLMGWDRTWNRKISSSVSAGPQWIISSDSLLTPSSARFAANASVRDKIRHGSLTLAYVHASNGGGGYVFGAEQDTVNATVEQQYTRRTVLQLTGGYRRVRELSNGGVTDGKFGAAEVTRKLGINFSAFASYTATYQNSSSLLPHSALNQLWQVFSVGIGFTPQPIHFRR
jgi:hypothetical protein